MPPHEQPALLGTSSPKVDISAAGLGPEDSQETSTQGGTREGAPLARGLSALAG